MSQSHPPFPFTPAALLRKVGNRVTGFYKRHVERDEFSLAVHQWFKDRGDETLRLSYDLSPTSVVMDLGGYRGDFADAIHRRYGCRVLVFEPVSQYYRACVARFQGNDKITCFNFGLADVHATVPISSDADGSSVVRSMDLGTAERIQLEPFDNVFKDLNLTQIDLLKLNIEGGEFDVLPHIIASGLIERISHVQVQFHEFVPDARAKRDAIRGDLAVSHSESWCYPFVWESWARRS